LDAFAETAYGGSLMARTDVMFSSRSDSWATPQSLYDELNAEFGFTLDPCADDENHKCEKYYTKEQDGLKQDWSGERVFCNPPYGKEVKLWVQKCFEEVYCGSCELAVMLLNVRTDTQWFHGYIYNRAEVRFLKGRLSFGDGENRAPFPSMIAVFRKAG
jgi:site-specific DNA-methyltransferase (adenine-specific)